MNADNNLVLIAMRNGGMDFVMYAINNVSWWELEHSLTFPEVWADPAIARRIAVEARTRSTRYRELGSQNYSFGEYICEAIDWSVFDPEFVLEVLWLFKTKRPFPKEKMAQGWRGTYMPWVFMHRPLPSKYKWCSDRPMLCSDRLIFEARAWRRDLLFYLPLAPHLLKEMCEFM